jgi:hypothetical protein
MQGSRSAGCRGTYYAAVARSLKKENDMLTSLVSAYQGLAPTYGDLAQSSLNNQVGYNVLSSAGTSETITAAQLLGGFYYRSGGSTTTATTDTAANIQALLGPNVKVGQTFWFRYGNQNSGTATLAAGTGVTLQGTTTVATTAVRDFIGTVTNVTAGSLAVTLAGMWANTGLTA